MSFPKLFCRDFLFVRSTDIEPGTDDCGATQTASVKSAK